MLAIIGGSVFSRLPELNITRREVFRTPYGDPSCPLFFGMLGGKEIVFLARHGLGHTYAPHEINYRANIDALKQAGVTQILSISAVSAMTDDLREGNLVLPHDLIDYTSVRMHTFLCGGEQVVSHPDFSIPYDENLRGQIALAAKIAGIALHQTAVYACLQGPRLPTRAEIYRYRSDGGDVYGMTGMPEAILAREKEIAYAHLCGITDSAIIRTPQSDYSASNLAGEKIRKILQHI